MFSIHIVTSTFYVIDLQEDNPPTAFSGPPSFTQGGLGWGISANDAIRLCARYFNKMQICFIR